jgi:glycosyltransferase involved in cell wall biosynthesis
VGALDRERNEQAAEWLVKEIWPKVRMLEPRAQLRLVGANPGERVRRLEGRPGVTITGWVRDLRAEYARARVVVAPMRSEAGALNKVIDSLAAGRPVVATPQANAGVEAPPGAITLAADAAGLARAIVRLLQDDATWQNQAAAARAFAQGLDWPAAAAALEAELSELAARRRVQ